MNSKIIDADSFQAMQSLEKKICYTVSVPHADKLIDADDVQNSMFAIKQHVCEDVICA